MRAIRGATTIESDTKDNIRAETRRLLDEIATRNRLDHTDVRCVVFSTTSDIHSLYPAEAARECGYADCALFSVAEPDMDGSLPLCIRALFLCEGDEKPEHVYLNRAVILRRDMTEKLNIALDGPAGSGKSTLAKALSNDYGILYLDTGAMYRAAALGCIRAGIDADNEPVTSDFVESLDVSVEYDKDTQKTLLNGEVVNDLIRTEEVSMTASKISAYRRVRVKMVTLQRKIAESMSCVIDGRDIGTNVLPGAKYKFYITASAEVRARRRFEENERNGIESDLESVLRDIKKRDTQDETRKFDPLIKADDAVEVDTSDMTVEEVVAYIKDRIQETV